MTDSRYQQVFGDAMDALYRHVGIDEAYRAAGHMFYTVESHATYLAQMQVGEAFDVSTRVLSVDQKRLRVLHRLHRRADDAVVATGEQMHVHVDVHAGKAAPIAQPQYARLVRLQEAAAHEPWPVQAGRSIGQTRD